MGSTSASRAFSSSGCFSVSRLAPATGTANPAGLARRRLPAEFPETPANGRTCSPRDLGDEPDPTPPKASRLGRRQQPPAPLVKIRRQSLVSIFDTIRVVHSQYIEDKPTLRTPLQPSTRSFRDQPKTGRDRSVIRASTRSPRRSGKTRASCGTGNQHQDRSNFHPRPPTRPFFRPCRQRPIPHPAGSPVSDFKETEPSHMQVQRSRTEGKKINAECHLCKWLRASRRGKTRRRSIRNSTNLDSIILGRTLREKFCGAIERARGFTQGA